jgi:hypothetical protein
MSPWSPSAGRSLGCPGLSDRLDGRTRGAAQDPGRRGVRRPQHRTRRVLRERGPDPDGHRSRPVRGAARRHRHGRALGAHLRRPGPAGAVLRVGALGRLGGCGRGRDHAADRAWRLGLAGDEPWCRAAGPRRGGRGAAAAARRLRRGRHPAGPARDDRYPVRRRGRVRQRGRHGQGVHEAAHVRARPAGRPVRRGARQGLAYRFGTQADPGRDRRTAGLAGVRQARPRRLEHRDHPGGRL